MFKNIFSWQAEKNILLSTYWHKKYDDFHKIWDPVFDPRGNFVWLLKQTVSFHFSTQFQVTFSGPSAVNLDWLAGSKKFGEWGMRNFHWLAIGEWHFWKNVQFPVPFPILLSSPRPHPQLRSWIQHWSPLPVLVPVPIQQTGNGNWDNGEWGLKWGMEWGMGTEMGNGDWNWEWGLKWGMVTEIGNGDWNGNGDCSWVPFSNLKYRTENTVWSFCFKHTKVNIWTNNLENLKDFVFLKYNVLQKKVTFSWCFNNYFIHFRKSRLQKLS